MKTEFVVRSDDGRALHAIRASLGTLLREIAAPEAEVFAAELVIGELLTNAHRYAPGDVRICFDLDTLTACLSVRDSGSGPTLPATLPDVHSECGRGLFIVQSLVDTLQSTKHDGWNEVRADLRVRRAQRV